MPEFTIKLNIDASTDPGKVKDLVATMQKLEAQATKTAAATKQHKQEMGALGESAVDLAKKFAGLFALERIVDIFRRGGQEALAEATAIKQLSATAELFGQSGGDAAEKAEALAKGVESWGKEGATAIDMMRSLAPVTRTVADAQILVTAAYKGQLAVGKPTNETLEVMTGLYLGIPRAVNQARKAFGEVIGDTTDAAVALERLLNFLRDAKPAVDPAQLALEQLGTEAGNLAKTVGGPVARALAWLVDELKGEFRQGATAAGAAIGTMWLVAEWGAKRAADGMGSVVTALRQLAGGDTAAAAATLKAFWDRASKDATASAKAIDAAIRVVMQDAMKAGAEDLQVGTLSDKPDTTAADKAKLEAALAAYQVILDRREAAEKLSGRQRVDELLAVQTEETKLEEKFDADTLRQAKAVGDALAKLRKDRQRQELEDARELAKAREKYEQSGPQGLQDDADSERKRKQREAREKEAADRNYERRYAEWYSRLGKEVDQEKRIRALTAADIKKLSESQLRTRIEEINKELAIVKKGCDDEVALVRAKNLAETELEKLKAQATAMANIDAMIQITNSLGVMFKKQKEAAIATAFLSVWKAAAGSMSDTPGPIWVRIAAWVTAFEQCYTAVTAMDSVEIGSGGGGGGRSAPTMSTGPSGNSYGGGQSSPTSTHNTVNGGDTYNISTLTTDQRALNNLQRTKGKSERAMRRQQSNPKPAKWGGS